MGVTMFAFLAASILRTSNMTVVDVLGWQAYAFFQGAALTGWWVLAHECGLGTSAPGTSAPGTSASEPAARALLTPPSARAGLPVSRRGARRAHGHAAGAEQAAAAPSSARTPAMRGALVRLAQSSRAGPARPRVCAGCAVRFGARH